MFAEDFGEIGLRQFGRTTLSQGIPYAVVFPSRPRRLGTSANRSTRSLDFRAEAYRSRGIVALVRTPTSTETFGGRQENAGGVFGHPSRQYLLAELRCAALRARLWQADIEAVGIALKGKLITPEQALELLHDCDALLLVEARGEAAQ
jgi:hypothetical protein